MPRGSWLFSQILFDVIIQDWRNLIVEFLHFLRNYIYCLHDGAEFSKINPSFFVDKASCTRQFESDLSLHSLALLFPIKEGSTSHLGLLPSGKKRKTALRCSEPLRSKVGGPKRSSPWLYGMGPPGEESLQFIIYN